KPPIAPPSPNGTPMPSAVFHVKHAESIASTRRIKDFCTVPSSVMAVPCRAVLSSVMVDVAGASANDSKIFGPSAGLEVLIAGGKEHAVCKGLPILIIFIFILIFIILSTQQLRG